jgi:diguanylate cyclase (GGDEF)-like protein/PAS domain S-box-containing protein
MLQGLAAWRAFVLSRHPVTLVSIGLIAVMLCFPLISLWSENQRGSAVHDSQQAIAVQAAYSQARYDAALELAFLREEALQPGATSVDRFTRASSSFVRAVKSIDVSDNRLDRATASAVLARHAAYVRAFRRFETFARVRNAGAAATLDDRTIEPLYSSLVTTINRAVAQQQTVVRQSMAHRRQVQGEADVLELAVEGVALLLALGLLVLLASYRRRDAQQGKALRASEERFRAVFEGSAIGINLTDGGGQYVVSNPAFQDMVGYSEEELASLTFANLTHADDIAVDLALYRELISGHRDRYTLEKRYVRKDGQVVWVRLTVSNFSWWDDMPMNDGSLEGRYIICVVEDISDRKRAEEALRMSEERHRVLVELSPEPIAVVAEGIVLYANPSALRTIGAGSLDQVEGKSILDFVHPDDHAQVIARATQVTETSEQAELAEERFVRLDGRVITVEIVAIPITWNGRTAAQCVFRDVTERKRFEEQLRHQALHDSLTGLPNRPLLWDRLEHAIRGAARSRQPVALFFLDLNRFKDVNDTFGHHVGDVLLKEVADRLRAVVRATDTVARVSGDEFAVVVPIAGESGVVGTANRLSRVFDQPFSIEGHRFDVSGSIGIAIYPTHGEDVTTLLRHADTAMYAAKRLERPYLFYAQEHDGASPERLQVVWELRTGIEAGELCLDFQPQVNLVTGGAEQVEALVRWHHPERGIIPPATFIAVAEEHGLMKRLTEWVLEEALRQGAEWSAAGREIRIAVNLSAHNLHDEHLVATVARLLAESGLKPSSLLLEITESAIMVDPAGASRTLFNLHELGIELSIDDFGTGYSSLASLQALPVDEIKVDRSFVRDMVTNAGNAHIVRSVVELAHNLGKRVVAEGVEDASTVQALTFLGCDLVQGYHLARPMGAAEYKTWLAERESRPRRRKGA